MSHWNDTSDFRSSAGRSSSENARRQTGPGREFFGRDSRGKQNFDRWAVRARAYLRSRTADHWLMFIGGLLLGALIG